MSSLFVPQESNHLMAGDDLLPVSPLVITEKRGRIGYYFLLPVFILFLSSAGLAVFFLLWFTVIRGVQPGADQSQTAFILQNGAFLVDEGTSLTKSGEPKARLLGLTISTLTTQIVAISTPILVVITAYRTAGAWLYEQAAPNSKGTNLPTPLQYGLLIKLSSTAGLIAIYDTARYLFRGKKKREIAPNYLITSFFMVIMIYILTHLIRLADVWLHVTASAILYKRSVPQIIPNVTTSSASIRRSLSDVGLASDLRFGIAFNDSVCIPGTPSCLIGSSGWGIEQNNIQVFQAGTLIAQNSSTEPVFNLAAGASGSNMSYLSLSVVTLNRERDLAIIVPSPMNLNTSWSGPSFGLRATCTNLTPGCRVKEFGTPIERFNCSALGYPYLPFDKNQLSYDADEITPGRVVAMLGDRFFGGRFGAWDGQGLLPENPQSVQLEFEWPLNAEDSSAFQTPNTFSNMNTMGIAAAYAECKLEFYNVTIGYDEGFYRLIESEPSSRNISGAMWGSLLNQMINPQLHSRLQARVFSDPNDDSVMAALNQELSRLVLGMFAGAAVNTVPSSLSIISSQLVGQYPIAPVVVYITLLFIYSFIVLGIFIWSFLVVTVEVVAPDGSSSTVLQLAQLSMTDPLMFVASAFPSKSGPPNHIVDDPLDLFNEGIVPAQRLALGVEDSHEGSKVWRNGVHERKGWSEEGIFS